MNAETKLTLDLPDEFTKPSRDERSKLTEALPRLLRGMGALAVIGALSSFLLQQWDQGNDLSRYLMLFATTLLLGGAGFIGGRLLHEPKGARTFLTLATVAIPVNFTILGALLYSQVNFDGGMAVLPEMATWRVADLSILLPVMLGAGVLLTLVARLGFMVLARQSAGSLTTLLVASNLLLLVPTRNAQLIGALLIASVALLSWRVIQLRSADPALGAFEGFLARAILAIAPGILLVRNLWLHAADEVFVLGAAAAVYLLLRLIANELDQAKLVRKMVEVASMLPAVLGAAAVAELVDGYNPMIASLLFVATLAAAAWEISLRSEYAMGYRRIAALIVSLGLLAILAEYGTLTAATVALASGIGMVWYGVVIKQRSLLVMGTLTALAGLGYQVVELIELVHLGNWVALAVVGFVTIFAASLLERHGAAARNRISSWKERVAAWEK